MDAFNQRFANGGRRQIPAASAILEARPLLPVLFFATAMDHRPCMLILPFFTMPDAAKVKPVRVAPSPHYYT
jgi:hypothetical protein